MSPADTVIVQMQDLLGKDNEARMNLPSTIGTNWRWRMKKDEFTDEIRDRLRELTRVYGRNAVKQYFCKEDMMLTEICKKKYNKTIKECSNEEIYFALLDMTKELAEDKVTEDGKKKKILATYEYDLGACMFCQLCVNACPHDAITFDQNFEHAVFDRTKLVLKLNHDGSKVIEKKKEV